MIIGEVERVKKRISIVLIVVMMLELVGCAKSSGGDSAEAKQIQVDEEISAGLAYEGRMDLEYATEYAVDYYSDGYDLITISDGSRFLVVPQKEEAPDDLDSDIVVLKQPVDHIYLVASATMDMFRSFDALDAISLSGTKKDGWYIDEARQAMDNGSILYAGKYSAPDYEQILDTGCNLSIQSTMIYHSPEIKENLEKFGIPVLVDHSSYETHPLGRTEWVKLYGVLEGKEDVAEQVFAEQKDAVAAASDGENTGKTVAFFYITSNGSVNVRKSGDYVPKMIELAGGNYIFSDLGADTDASSSVNMQMEEFYARAKDADYLIYNSTIEGEVKSLDALLAKSDLLSDFKAVKDGNVFCTTQNLYQRSMELGTMTGDIHTMLEGEENADETYTFLFRLQ